MVPAKDRLVAKRRLAARRKARRRRLGYWTFGLFAAAGLLGVSLHYGLKASGEREQSRDVGAFLDELRSAARGMDPGRTSYGGRLDVESRGGKVIVTATAVPQALCVGAGWELVKEGRISVNGVTPQRVSAARLADLCSREPGGATLEWAPKEKE